MLGWQFSMGNGPRKILVKAMTVNRSPDDVFDFFEDVKNWEKGGALKSMTKTNDEWWTFQTPTGDGKLKLNANKELRTLDHDFIADGLDWDVHVRVIPNGSASTMTWTFICPEKMTEEQFVEQLKNNFEKEMRNWKKVLENT